MTVLKLVKRVHGRQSWALELAPGTVALDALELAPSGETVAITRDVNGQTAVVEISAFGGTTTTVLGNPCGVGAYRFGGIYAQATSAWVNQHDSKYAVTSTDVVIAAGTRAFSLGSSIGVSVDIPILDAVVFSQDSKIYELPSVAMFAGKHNDENFNISVSAPENAVILSNTPEQPLGILIRQFDLAEFVSH